MKLGDVLKKEREKKGIGMEEIAERLELSVDEYSEIEAGESPLEKYGALILKFAQTLEQPVSSLYYPCGLPFREVDDYRIEFRRKG